MPKPSPKERPTCPSCGQQRPEWKELQRLFAEGLAEKPSMWGMYRCHRRPDGEPCEGWSSRSDAAE